MRPLMPPVQTPDNLFHDGNPLTGELGTIVDAEHLNNVQGAVRDAQSELITVLNAAGINVDPSKQNQLLTALKALLLSRSNPFGDIKSDGTVKTALENLGLSNVLHKGDFGVGQAIRSSAAQREHTGSFFYEPGVPGSTLYPNSVVVMESGGPSADEWGQLAISYGADFKAYLGRHIYNGLQEVSELYHDKRKPTTSDVGAQPVDSTLTSLSGKDAAGIRALLQLKSAALRDVGNGGFGSQSPDIPDMSFFPNAYSASSGWYKLPGGDIVQSGSALVSGGVAGARIDLPIAFPGAGSSIFLTYRNNAQSTQNVPILMGEFSGNSAINVYTNLSSGSFGLFWLVLGR
ncbi:gp53-like domain-containing protein [Enterobacter asburiae]